jgi:pimeloyl-ACP methyl ester carboxylesterase
VARFEPWQRPAGYAPRLVLDARVDDEGGPVRQPIAVAWRAESGPGGGEMLLLLHGYNNHRAEAEAAYQAFRVRQEPVLRGPLNQPLDTLLADTFWPGDARLPGVLDRLDPLHYPTALATARDEVAPLLAQCLLEDPVRPARLHIVGHSMGCRLALELIEQLPRDGGPVIGRVALMAAAVPTFMLQPGGRFEYALARAEAVCVMSSVDDAVLQLAFPFGQTLAGPWNEGFLPEALGRHGRVPAGAGAQVAQVPIDGAGHSDYWGWAGPRDGRALSAGERAANAQAARTLSDFLNLNAPPRREPVAAAPAPMRRRAPPAREPGFERVLGEAG